MTPWTDPRPRYQAMAAAYEHLLTVRGPQPQPQCGMCRGLGTLLFVFPEGVTGSDESTGVGTPCLRCTHLG
ncbi:hypothetical protein ACWD7M_17045 [Streptomyces griseus]